MSPASISAASDRDFGLSYRRHRRVMMRQFCARELDMRRLSGTDSLFLAGETATWHQHIGGLSIVDPTDAPGFGFDALLPEHLDEIAARSQAHLEAHQRSRQQIEYESLNDGSPHLLFPRCQPRPRSLPNRVERLRAVSVRPTRLREPRVQRSERIAAYRSLNDLMRVT